jgi:DNA-binding IclR family transcriptional regulator
VRGLQILEVLARAEGRTLGVSGIAGQVGLGKATVTRLLHTLIACGYAAQDAPSRQYRLTGKILNLAHLASAGIDVLAVARPHLRNLRDRLNETVHLGMLDGLSVVYLDKLESTNSIQLLSAVGQTMPLHSTSLGKAMLAALPDDELEAKLAQMTFTRRTERTITSVEDFRVEIARTRARGYAIDDRENEPLGACVAAPVVDARGRLVAAISVAGPHFRVRDRLGTLGQATRATAQLIAQELGASVAGPLGYSSEPGAAPTAPQIAIDTADPEPVPATE